MLVLDWLELVVRWVHVIAGVAWIGASFYFNWLNDQLAEPETREPHLEGELWSVHGGAFYRAMKYRAVPVGTLSRLHWFKWEAYLTWMSGFGLLILVYYLGAEIYLLDPGVAALSPPLGIAIALGTLCVGWIVYDQLCKSSLSKRSGPFTLLGLVLIGGVSYGLFQLFSARGAYMHVGALLGTIMAANVFFVIIPAHVELVQAVKEGRDPDPAEGARAAMRSRHNNYFTLPVLFVMISAHYPFTYGHPWGWAILLGLFVVGGVTRHGFNVRNSGRSPAWLFPAAALGLLAVAVVASGTDGRGRAGARISTEPVEFAQVEGILLARCVVCHAAEPANQLFAAAPGGILLETRAQVEALRSRIRAVAVETRIMPLGNLTNMTDEERGMLGAWIDSGEPPQ